jgi:exodeoxyribonuclease X
MFRLIDLETTGFEPDEDEIVEIASVDVSEAGVISNPMEDLVNPGFPIPPESSAVHHLIDEDVATAGKLSEVLPHYVDPALIYVAHNAKFEKSFLTDLPEVHWLCTYKAAARVWPEAPSHSNQVLRYWLKLNVPRDIGMAHRALPDCYVTAELLSRLLEKASLDDMLRWTNMPVLKRKCAFGKHVGTDWAEVPKDYLQWIVRNGTFDEDTMYTAKVHLGLVEHV